MIKRFRYSVSGRLGVALMIAAVLCFTSAAPASAQELTDYFQFSYDPVTFDKTDIKGGEVFNATIAGRATCAEDFPVSGSEASITSMVVARHAVSGAELTLNASYTVTIKPFPSKAGETAEISQSVPLKFPAQAASGEYSVIGRIIEAKVKVLFWVPVTSFLPQEQQMGTVKYTSPGGTNPPPAPEPPPTAEPEPVPPEPTPITDTSAPPQEKSPTTTPEPEQYIPWWMFLIVMVAAGATAFNVYWFLRHRRR